MAANDQTKHQQFQALILRHRDLIERLCMRRASGDYHRCAELRQDCYISIWRHLASLRHDASPLQETLWVVWQCRSVFSRLRFLRRTHLFLPLDDSLADWYACEHLRVNPIEVSTLAAPDESTLRDYIDSLADILTPHERQALQLMAEGYNPDEMANELGIKPHSAVQLRYRIIAKLRSHFKKL